MNGWALVTIVAAGLLAGFGLELAIVRVPIWHKMDPTTFAVDFRRSCKLVDIYIPALHTVTLLATIGFTIDTSDGTTEVLGIITLVLLLVTLVTSRVFNVPIRQKFINLPEGEVPPGAEAMRRVWGLAHQGRAAAIIVAFVLLVAAVVQT